MNWINILFLLVLFCCLGVTTASDCKDYVFKSSVQYVGKPCWWKMLGWHVRVLPPCAENQVVPCILNDSSYTVCPHMLSSLLIWKLALFLNSTFASVPWNSCLFWDGKFCSLPSGLSESYVIDNLCDI